MTLTESIRSAVIDMRHDGEAIRPFAARIGVPHMTLHRFLSGASVDSDTLDRLAALGSPSTGDGRLREAVVRFILRNESYERRGYVDLDPLRAALSTGAPDTGDAE
jgi:Ser/Thr protein kinase RdoA (MazF antagonist)